MPKAKKTSKFWSVRAEKTADGSTVGNLNLYGVISSVSWWGDEVTPKEFRQDLEALGDISELNVHIFSDGGDVFAGWAIYSILKQQKVTVNAYIEGIAASIATIVMLAADHIFVSTGASMLIHNPMLGLIGYYNRLELENMIRDLDKISEPMVAAYQAKTGMPREQVIAVMNGENTAGTWFTAQEAIDAGLADGFIPEESEVLDAVACIGPNAYRWNGIDFDLSKYANAPKITNRNRRFTKMTNTKRTKASKTRKVKAELITITCPECGAVFEYEGDQLPEDGGEAVAQIIEVTCPECGATFEWDTENPPAVPGEDDGEPVAQIIEVTCPECGATFEWDADPAAPANPDSGEGTAAKNGKKARAQIFSVTCPECGTTFEWDNDPAAPATVVETGEAAAKRGGYNAGVIAERRRIVALDSIAQADPASADVVAKAKAEGWSFERTSRTVFKNIATREAKAQSGGAAYLEARNGEIKASGSMRVGAAPNSGTAGNIGASAQNKAVNMITAGMGKNKR